MDAFTGSTENLTSSIVSPASGLPGEHSTQDPILGTIPQANTLLQTGTDYDSIDGVSLPSTSWIDESGDVFGLSGNVLDMAPSEPAITVINQEGFDGITGTENSSVAQDFQAFSASLSTTLNTPSQALFVTASANLKASDLAIKNRLESMGYQVTVKDDNASQSGDANGQDLIVISESVNSGTVGSKFTDADVPVVVLEPYLYDDLKMTGNTVGEDFGFANRQTEVAIANSTHPLADGLNNTVQVYNKSGSLGWGNPGSEAIEIAGLTGNGDRSTVFGYEEGATLADGSQAGDRRVGLFVMNKGGEGTRLTEQGWQLFDSAIEWAAGSTTGDGNGSGDPGTPPSDPPDGPTPDPNPTPTPAGSPITIQAESMTLSGYTVESRPEASGGELIQTQGTGSAATTFTGDEGTYDLVLSYFDENDGQSEVTVKAGDQTYVLKFDQDLGTENYPTANNRIVRQVVSGIQLSTGDTIEIQGGKNGEEYARVDYIELVPEGATPSESLNYSGPDLDPVNPDPVNPDPVDPDPVDPTPKPDPAPDPTPTPEPTPSTPSTVHLEAESMTLSGYSVESRPVASGGELIRTDSSGQATSTFEGVSGAYDLILSYFDENDGQSDVTVKVGDQTYALTFDRDQGENYPADNNRIVRKIASGINVSAGDVIEIQGDKNVEEYARVDYIELVPEGGAPSEPLTPDSGVDNPDGDPAPTPTPTPIPDPAPPAPPTPTPTTPNPDGHFQVIGTKIYDPNGREFIVKGTNAPGENYVWPGNTLADLPKIDDWGFNFIRLTNYLGPKPNGDPQYDINDIDQIVSAANQRGMVVMLDAHDNIGEYWTGSELTELKDFWREQAEKFKDNPYVWFNIANEPGGLSSVSEVDKWITQHQEVIKVIRNEVGAQNPIVVDGHFWGQDLGEWDSSSVNPEKSAIISHGDKLKSFGGKNYDNILFSVHLYDQWRFSEDKMDQYFELVEQAGHAIIVGEYGVENANRDTSQATRDMFDVVVPREIGRVVWSWWGGDDNDLTTSSNGGGQHYNGSNLSELGQLVWSDNRRQENLEQLPR